VRALDTSFTFRLTHDDKAALDAIAGRMNCDRGAALRRLIHRAAPGVVPGEHGRFVAHGQVYPVRLQDRSACHER
jgi:predicted transcriptional regulator